MTTDDAQAAPTTLAPVPAPRTETVPPAAPAEAVREHGGPSGLEPTRYGDWERKGRCIDF